MASSPLSSLSNRTLLYRPHSIPHRYNSTTLSFLSQKVSRSRTSLVKPIAVGTGPDLLGDIGARDPFPEELESNFGENVLGNTDTLHRILIPNITALSLAETKLEPLESLNETLSDEDSGRLLRKVVGWRIVEVDGVKRVQCEWRLRDAACCEELVSRINKLLDGIGHYPSLSLEQPNVVKAEIYTSSVATSYGWVKYQRLHNSSKDRQSQNTRPPAKKTCMGMTSCGTLQFWTLSCFGELIEVQNFVSTTC